MSSVYKIDIFPDGHPDGRDIEMVYMFDEQPSVEQLCKLIEWQKNIPSNNNSERDVCDYVIACIKKYGLPVIGKYGFKVEEVREWYESSIGESVTNSRGHICIRVFPLFSVNNDVCFNYHG